MQLPSDKQIGDKVNLNFGEAGTIKNAEVTGIHFSEDKIFYDVDIEMADGNWTEIKHVDSTCVKKIDEPGSEKAATNPTMTVEDIARAAHELNKAYCESIGDNSQTSWEEAPEWQRTSAINGVNFHLQHPEASPNASHNSWLRQKEAEGWIYGPVKNPETKEHPCFVPYDQLPTEQKAKDYIFRQTVHSLKKFLR